ncbi:MAG TPA: thioredoxin family protein [Cyanobacteria bacterium UBA8530]|nr:thioredoxin family protein [Cyanobacteria bacterium UBA8530]
MKKITVYGPGCAKCKDAEEIVRRAVAETGIEAEVNKVSDIKDMMRAGIMSTPAVSVDGTIKVTGRVPKLDEVKGWLA